MINVEKLRREAVDHRYRKMEMDPKDVIDMCEEIQRLRKDLQTESDRAHSSGYAEGFAANKN